MTVRLQAAFLEALLSSMATGDARQQQPTGSTSVAHIADPIQAAITALVHHQVPGWNEPEDLAAQVEARLPFSMGQYRLARVRQRV